MPRHLVSLGIIVVLSIEKDEKAFLEIIDRQNDYEDYAKCFINKFLKKWVFR